MRILHFTESFSQPTETFIKRFVEKSCLFADVGIVAFNFQNIEIDLKKNVSLFEITNRLYTRKTIAGVLRFAKEKLSGKKLWYEQLNHAIETFKPDIIHCHFGNMGVMMMQFDKILKKNIPYVTSFYGYDASSQPVLDHQYRDSLNELWQQGSGFFAEGPALIKKLIALGCPGTKCSINPLLIPIEDHPVKVHYRDPSDPVKFLFAGRFIEKKGLQVFLKAIGQLKGTINDFTIDIIGNGPYKNKYEQLISEYDLAAVVKWHDILKHTEMIAMLKDYDFLVHPSLKAVDNDSEGGAPTIIIEAQATGLPVITSDHADIPFVMGYPDLIAKENDVESLMAVIEKITGCANIREYAQHGMDKVQHQHNLRLSTVYESNLQKVISYN